MYDEKSMEQLDRFEAVHEFKNDFKTFKSNLKKSDIIVAFPGSFFFIGEHSVMQGQPALSMAIPMYVYVGVKESNTEGINIEMWQRNLEGKGFEKFRWKEGEREYLERELENMFRDENIKPKYNIFALFEVPPRCGLNSSGAFSAGISVSVGILNSMFSPYDVQEWQTIKQLDKLKENEKFKKALEIAWRFDWIIQEGSSGIGPFVSLVGYRGEPIIYFLENPELEKKEWKSQWYAYLLSEIYERADISRFKKWPFALIYSGNHSLTRVAFDKIKKVSVDSSLGIEKFVEKLEKRNIKLNEIATPLRSILVAKIADDLENGQINEGELAEPIRNSINEIINDAKRGRKDRPKNVSEYILERIWSVMGGFSILGIGNINTKLVDMMNTYQSVLSALGLSTSNIEKICKEFQLSGYGAKLTGSGCGGDVIVFSPYPHEVDRIKKIIKENNYIVHFKSWEKKEVINTLIKISKYLPIIVDVNENLKKEAYVGVIAKKIPESPEYGKSGEFSEEALNQQRKIIEDIRKGIERAKEGKVNLDMLILPEYTLPPEDDEHHSKIVEELISISMEENIIIVGGSYLSKNLEDICLVFLPNGRVEKVWRLNRCNYDPEEFKEGYGVKIFRDSRVGDFCIVVCFDFLSEKIPEIIRKKASREQSLTVIVVSQCRDRKRYLNIAKELANPRGKPSPQGLLAHVILADSFYGQAYYTAPVRKSVNEKEEICKPILKKDDLHIYRLLIEELKKARTPGGGSEIFYSCGVLSNKRA